MKLLVGICIGFVGGVIYSEQTKSSGINKYTDFIQKKINEVIKEIK